jgi:co-chaperonin GroES (HSP10)
MKKIIVVDRRGEKREEEVRESRIIIPSRLRKTKRPRLVKVTPRTIFIHPTRGRIIVQEDQFSYEGLVEIPDQSKRRPTTGTILEVGRDCYEEFQPGRKVGYGLYSGTVMEFKGWDPETRIIFRILGQDEVLSFIDEKAPEFIGVGVGT